MPRASRRDRRPNVAGMRAVAPPPRADLVDLVKNHVWFLVSSSKAFDAGHEHEGLRLAVSLRVLMHETAASSSLLGQLGLRDQIEYFDTALTAPHGAQLLPGSRLALMTMGDNARYIPRLCRPPIPDRWIDRRRWWDRDEVIEDVRGETFTRKDLVLFAANEDGGAHVDPELTPRYEALTRGNAFGWRLHGPQGEFDWANGPALPSMRMIAHEMLVTLQRAVPEVMGGLFIRERTDSPGHPAQVWDRNG